MTIQRLLNIASIAAEKNLRNIILSPGSRVAPLTLAFVRHPFIETISLSDERSAAYTALGMARAKLSQAIEFDKYPLPLVGIACTSGSAAYNYAPAVAEAFYQKIPLVIFTADRPPEWIDQQDGQTIRQRDLYIKHVKSSYELPVDYSHHDAVWQAQRIVNEALNLAVTYPYGPVHINVPIREPFYPEAQEQIRPSSDVKVVKTFPSQTMLDKTTWNELLDIWESTPRKLIVAGQGFYPPSLLKALTNIYQDYHIPCIADVISNLSSLPHIIKFQDIFLPQLPEQLAKDLSPDLLITFGDSLISKSLKLYLRQFKAREHWHIQKAGVVADTFQSLSHIIPIDPAYFFSQLFSDLDFQNLLQHDEDGEDNPYDQLWQNINSLAQQYIEKFSFSDSPFSELEAVKIILQHLPHQSALHVANSMPVRYVNFWGLSQQVIEVVANRGTSGIDGCTSTAVGYAMAQTNTLVTLITGDMAFFYDRNALWNNYLPSNLRIIILNNHGGNIFRMIKGPKHQPEFEEYFETHQALQAQHTAQDFQLDYQLVKDASSLNNFLPEFFQTSKRSKILEITTDKQMNAEVLEIFKSQFQI